MHGETIKIGSIQLTQRSKFHGFCILPSGLTCFNKKKRTTEEAQNICYLNDTASLQTVKFK